MALHKTDIDHAEGLLRAFALQTELSDVVICTTSSCRQNYLTPSFVPCPPSYELSGTPSVARARGTTILQHVLSCRLPGLCIPATLSGLNNRTTTASLATDAHRARVLLSRRLPTSPGRDRKTQMSRRCRQKCLAYGWNSAGAIVNRHCNLFLIERL